MKTLKTPILCAAAALSLMLGAETSRNLSYAIEDAAYQAVTRLNADGRAAHVKRVAFVRLAMPKPGLAFKVDAAESQTFEAALLSVPSKFQFVVHSSHQSDWVEIDRIFDQAEDFESWDPSTCPALKKLTLADTLLLAKIIDGTVDEKTDNTTIRVSLRLIEVSTARTLWGGNVEGVWKDAGPENQALNIFARRAMELAAADAVSKLPPSLDGYGVFLLPLEGIGGRAMTQVFLNALTAAGKQDRVRIYDLPGGNAADRMLARFLRERAGSGQAVDSSILRKIEAASGGKAQGGKLAILTGMVTTGRIFPETIVDPTGRPVDRLTGSFTQARQNPTLFEVVADFKFRDINDQFRVVAAVSANGAYRHDVGSDFVEQLRSFVTVRNAVVLVVILLLIWFVSHFMLRVR